MRKIVAFAGPKGCGKDTAARMIIDAFPDDDIRQIAFADPIKEKLMHLFELHDIGQYDSFKRSVISYQMDGRTRHVEGRHVVREVGMLMREYDKEQFVSYVHKKIVSNPNTSWIITDMRFENELNMLKAVGAKLVRIYNPTTEVKDAHVTEQGFDYDVFDFVLQNDKSLAVFEQRVIDLYNSL